MNREDVPNLQRHEDGTCWQPLPLPICPRTRKLLAKTCDRCGSSDSEMAFQLETGLAPWPVIDRTLFRCRLCGRIESNPLRSKAQSIARPPNKPWRPAFVLFEGRPLSVVPLLPTKDAARLVAAIRQQMTPEERIDLAARIID